MALESGTYISDLNPSNPVGATDKVSTLDDHVRLIKATLQTTFPGISGEVSATHTELNFLDGVTGTTGTGQLVLDDAPTIADLTVTDSITLPAASVADAALSSNVPLKNTLNTFTAAQTISTTLIWQYFRDSDAGENEKLSRLQAGGPGIIWATRTDEDGTGETWLFVQRNGVEVTEIELNADVLDFNGNADISGTLAVGGAATFSNNVTVGGTISGNGSGLTSLNASNLSSGTVPDARLSSNVPRLNVTNTFTAPLTISTNNQWLYFLEADAGENEKLSRIQGAGGGLLWATRTDEDGTGETWLFVQRNGVEVTEIELNADLLDFNGNADISGTLAVGGARIASEGGVIYHDSTDNLGGKIVLSSSEATTAGQVGAAGDMRFVYS